jgi:hypothetical protein
MSKDKIQSLVAYKKELRKSILKNYQALKEKISLLKHYELKELVSEWNFDSEELDNDLLSLDTDDLRNNYLDEYLELLDKEISQLDLNSIEYLKKAIFRTFIIFKFYDDDYGFLNYYYEIYEWYEEIYKQGHSQDKKIQSAFTVIAGGME